MRKRNLLIILNPRQIPDCIRSLERLPVDKVWIGPYTELDAREHVRNVMESMCGSYDFYTLVSDDVIIPRDIWTDHAVSAYQICNRFKGRAAFTSHCRLDKTSELHNVQETPLVVDMPTSLDNYNFIHKSDMKKMPEPKPRDGSRQYFRTYFSGLALLTMPSALWSEFPYDCYAHDGRGFASDYHISKRLQNAGVPIFTHRDSEIIHVKDRVGYLDTAPAKRLLIGEVQGSVRFEYFYPTV